ncbi:RimK family protein [Marinimicrobium sp. ABcell2]|uniref:RimK family protein n=1 Tax=Marinimicrobium sp. ABcell2 TaxID=3069751 RepID=UPI0027B0D1C7|nr:RimK family protein [Marinimicrobium sp. ABcell2]MDQ2076763.1 RimK family protein [Marinimicrobium sp. ABcell2]
MTQLKIVIENASDWAPFYPSEDVILAQDYIEQPVSKERYKVINLCRQYTYSSTGYYCSLLAEARSHQVIPAVKHIQDLSRRIWLGVINVDAQKQLSAVAGEAKEHQLWIYFGFTAEPQLTELARQVFEQIPVPILKVTFQHKGSWRLAGFEAVALNTLNEQQQTDFANALDSYSHLVWRKAKVRKNYRYDMAILVDPNEPFPPSNSVAINRFIKSAKKHGILAETITRKDLGKLSEYDALFIRATTSVNHYTYKFARLAQAEGLVVMDDPDSILRCTNKIYLAQLLENHGLPTPKTRVLTRSDLNKVDELIADLGLPIVLKVPDGSFSVGVKKVKDKGELSAELKAMFKSSALLLAQAYVYTEFDWRIGVMNNQALYACRYYMAKNHWQIYNHAGKTNKSGGFDAMPTFEVPKPVLKAAINATKHIGDGLYGVDLKQSGNSVYLIEVNDNPSIESAVEDKFLEGELYDAIMGEFKRRLDLQ